MFILLMRVFQIATKVWRIVVGQAALLLLLPLNAQTSPLDNWHWRNPLPQGNPLSSVIFAGGRFVVVGELGALISIDGLNWTTSFTPGAFPQAVTYGNGKYVSFGKVNGFQISTNGTDWTSIGSVIPISFSAWGVTFGNNLFVAVSTASTGTSSDGIIWRSFSPPPATIVSSLTFGNNLFVAASQSGGILTSTNGQRWNSINTNGSWRGIGYVNNLFIAAGQLTNTTAVFVSPDAQTWTPYVYASTNILRGVSYGNGLFVAVGDAMILTSSDGQVWASQQANTTYSLRSVAFGNGRFVTVGDNGIILASEDGTNWVSCVVGNRTEVRGVTYGDKFVAVGASGMVLDSSDGQLWQAKNTATSVDLQCIAAGNSVYAAGAATGDVLSSNDGTVWVYHVTGSTNQLMAMCYGSGLFVTAGKAGTILSSPDGASWTKQSSGVTNDLLGAGFGVGRFMIGGTAGITLSSSDGINWTNLGSMTTNSVTCLTCGRGIFVACDNGGYIYTAADGVNWTNWVSPNTRSPITSIAYGGGVFVATLSNGGPRTSGDTTNWTYRPGVVGASSSGAAVLNSVAYGRGSFVAVGAFGAIEQSDPVLTLQAGGLSSNGFLLTCSGELGPSHVLQSSADLSGWSDVLEYGQTNTQVLVLDASATNSVVRFYRIRPE
jgi:hypothetical protein